MGTKRPRIDGGSRAKKKPRKERENVKPYNAQQTARNEVKSKPSLLFQPRPDWHASELPAIPIDDAVTLAPSHITDALHQHGQALLEKENAAYASSHLKSTSSHKFLSTIMTSGTLEDKVSALTLLVQESPLHTTKALENLIGLAKKRSRNQALMALSALKDLLGQGVVLPSERKLRAFNKQPQLLAALNGRTKSWTSEEMLPGNLQDSHILVWTYEDWLKKSYFDLLKVLETWCNDEIPYARSRAITYVWELLKEKPEQEENLLRLLVNKLGDTDKKIASRASHLLLQLQNTHPVMKEIIIRAIESECLYRPGQNAHARYYAVITLNQTVLSAREQAVAGKLLDVYFALFVTLLKVSRQKSIPLDQVKVEPRPDQGGGGKPGRKARQKQLEKLQVQGSEIELNDKIIAQVLTGVNRSFPFADTKGAHFEEQLDTLFRITHSANFGTSVQALMLIQQISAAKHHGADRFYRVLYESLLDQRLLTSSKQILFLNLLYRSLKADVSIKRIKAFVKRLVQIISLHEPAFVCGVLYLIRELQSTFPSIKAMFDQPEAYDEGVEIFKDVDQDDSGVLNETEQEVNSAHLRSRAYDGRKRDPEYSDADKSCLWELLPLINHFHPSVSLFATRLLMTGEMPPKPDPSLHTIMHFLDRFVYRNAKTKTEGARGSSIMQPMAASAAADVLIKKRDGNRTELPLNSEAFWLKKSEDVAADEVFFHQYFHQSNKKRSSKKDTEAEEEASDVAINDDGSADEEEIWKALVDSRPELEGVDEDEEGFSDVNIEDMESDDENDQATMAQPDGQGAQSTDEEDALEAADTFDLDSDEDAFVDSDDDVPVDVPGDDGQADETGGSSGANSNKERRARKKKLKQLPTFASMEDYAKLMEEDDDED